MVNAEDEPSVRLVVAGLPASVRATVLDGVAGEPLRDSVPGAADPSLEGAAYVLIVKAIVVFLAVCVPGLVLGVAFGDSHHLPEAALVLGLAHVGLAVWMGGVCRWRQRRQGTIAAMRALRWGPAAFLLGGAVGIAGVLTT